MPVSPQDFALYSRMTGTPVPMDAMTRMQMAPDVYKFTKDFAKKPNILEATGNLVKTIGKTVGTGIAAAAAAPAFVESPETTAEKHDQRDVKNQTSGNLVAEATKRGAEIADSETVPERLSESQTMGPAFDEMIGEAATGDKVESFLDQFKGEGTPGIDTTLLGAIEQGKFPVERIGEGLAGPATSLPSYEAGILSGLRRFEHPDIKADGGEHDDDLVGAGNFKTETPITPETAATPSVSDRKDDFMAKLVEGAYSIPMQGQFHGKSLGLTVIPATNGEAQRGFVIANKPIDKSPTTATTYGFGVSPKSEDYLKDYPITEQNFDSMMERGLSEAKSRGKRKAGQIFGYLSVPKRVVTGTAQLGGFGQIDPNFALPSMQD